MREGFRRKRARPAARMVVAIGFLLLFPPVVFGSVGRFLPDVYRFGAYLEVDMNHESNTSKTAGRRTTLSDTYLKERIGVYSRGFIYHPRFISFYLMAAGGLDQERYKSDGTDTSWVTGNNLEYDLRLKFLPRHPYSLELYTLRRDPFTRPVFSADSRTTTFEKGAIFDYKQRPFFFNASYITDTLSARTYTMESDTVRVSGSHVAGIAANSINYSHTDSITSTNLTSNRKNIFFSNTLTARESYLTSSLSEIQYHQKDDSASFLQDKNFSWSELLAVQMPWNFKTHGWYELRKNWYINGGGPVLGTESETLTETENAKFQISHRLYDSVRTNYDLNYITTRTTSGFLRAVSQYASGFYTKKIPRGRLIAGGHGSVSVWDRKDSLDIINEIHTAQILGINYFTLRVPIPDEPTIVIRVKNPDTGLLVPLVLNLHYTITPDGNSFEIKIINLPSSVIGNRLLHYVYEFHATYSLLSQDVKLETIEIGFDLRLELFNNLFTPYVTYIDTNQTILSGTLLGGVQDSTSETVGLLIRKSNLEFLGEYQSFASNLNPSRIFRSELSYLKPLTTSSFLLAKARYRESDRLRGAEQRQAYVEKISDLELRYQKNLLRQRLRLFFNTLYSQRRATTDSDSYYATAHISWMMGKMRLDGGATLNYVTSEIIDGKQTNMKEYYYLTIRRDLF